MTTTTIKTKNYLPLAITQLHVDNMLEYDTNWINNEWDGNWETLRDAISDGDYNDYPYMLYGGSKAQRHELHRKLGSNFEHTSINMDDGSRVMIIINYPGWIHTGDDLSVCFFTRAPWHGARGLRKDDPNRIQAEARTRVYKMGPRTVAMYLPQQQYESKSDADQRIADAQTLDTWRERANLLIGHAKPETQEEYEKRTCAEELSKSEPEDVLSDGSIPLHKISSDKSLLIAQKLLTTDIAGAISIAHKSGVSQYSDSLEGRLLQGDIQMATQLAMQLVLDANVKAMQERMNARAEAWSEMSEPPPQPALERHEATASLCGNK